MLYWGIDHSPTLFRFPKRRGPRFLWHNGARIELTQDPADPFRPSSLSLSHPTETRRWSHSARLLWTQRSRHVPRRGQRRPNAAGPKLPSLPVYNGRNDPRFFHFRVPGDFRFSGIFSFFRSSLDALFQFRVPGNFLCSGIYSFVRSSLDYAVGTQRSAFFQLVAGTR